MAAASALRAAFLAKLAKAAEDGALAAEEAAMDAEEAEEDAAPAAEEAAIDAEEAAAEDEALIAMGLVIAAEEEAAAQAVADALFPAPNPVWVFV